MRRKWVNGDVEAIRENLVVPDHVADWDAPAHWERERFASMKEHLHGGMFLWDVGAEHGWQSAIYARWIGGADRMILIEPTPDFWRNIRLTFEANDLGVPYAMLCGLVGALDRDGPRWFHGAWPDEAAGDEVGAGGYRYLHEPKHLGEAHVTTVDAMVRSGLDCDALTIDVEGAEFQVLRGARETLIRRRPLVWVSIHPDLLARDYLDNAADLRAYMHGVGYDGEWLETDHEEHWLFTPRSGV